MSWKKKVAGEAYTFIRCYPESLVTRKFWGSSFLSTSDWNLLFFPDFLQVESWEIIFRFLGTEKACFSTKLIFSNQHACPMLYFVLYYFLFINVFFN